MKSAYGFRLFVLAGTAAALVVAVVTYFGIPNGDGLPGFRGDEYLSLVSAPDSYDDLVDVDLIATGRIGRIVSEGWEGPYNEEQLLEDSSNIPLPRLYFTYYEILVEEMILADVDRKTGNVMLRLNGKTGDKAANFMPMPQEGLKALFALHANPDGLSYGSGPWGIVSLEGNVPKFLDWDGTTVDFKAEYDVDEFLENVRRRSEAR